MRPIAKPFLAGIAILFALVAVALLGLNAWLALPATRESLQREISRAVGMPVTIGSTIALPLPLPVIRIGNIQAQALSGLNAFKAEVITLQPKLSDLLLGRITASGVSLKNPSLRITTDPRPSAPPSEPNFQDPAPSSESVSPLPSPTLTTPASIKITATPSVQSVRINGGDITYLDAAGRPILVLKGLDVRSSLEVGAWKGMATAASAVIGSGLILRNIQAPFSSSSQSSTGAPLSVDLTPLSALLGDGTLSGNATISTDPHSPDYSITLHLEGAKLGRLLADASMGSSSAEGAISGDVRLAGTAGKGATMNGEGTLLCNDVTIQPVDFLRQIGQFLSIDELKLLRLTEGKCLFRIEQGRFVIDDLLLRSENLILAANGPLGSTGELNLDSRLLFNEKLTSRLRGLLGNKLTPAPEQGYTQLSFRVTGPALSPKTDLLERLTGIKIGGDLGGIGALLQGLFGAPKPSPQPTPQPVP
jgi:hypothetical protein